MVKILRILSSIHANGNGVYSLKYCWIWGGQVQSQALVWPHAPYVLRGLRCARRSMRWWSLNGWWQVGLVMVVGIRRSDGGSGASGGRGGLDGLVTGVGMRKATEVAKRPEFWYNALRRVLTFCLVQRPWRQALQIKQGMGQLGLARMIFLWRRGHWNSAPIHKDTFFAPWFVYLRCFEAERPCAASFTLNGNVLVTTLQATSKMPRTRSSDSERLHNQGSGGENCERPFNWLGRLLDLLVRAS
eukprot:1156572-Pelagomonas_calceolata.AAC.4